MELAILKITGKIVSYWKSTYETKLLLGHTFVPLYPPTEIGLDISDIYCCVTKHPPT